MVNGKKFYKQKFFQNKESGNTKSRANFLWKDLEELLDASKQQSMNNLNPANEKLNSIVDILFFLIAILKDIPNVFNNGIFSVLKTVLAVNDSS